MEERARFTVGGSFIFFKFKKHLLKETQVLLIYVNICLIICYVVHRFINYELKTRVLGTVGLFFGGTLILFGSMPK